MSLKKNPVSFRKLQEIQVSSEPIKYPNLLSKSSILRVDIHVFLYMHVLFCICIARIESLIVDVQHINTSTFTHLKGMVHLRVHG